MENENSVAKPKSWFKRILKFAGLAALALIAVIWAAGLIWKYSGSNQWELVGEKNGVKIYSLKSPGSDTNKLKSVFRLRTSLSSLVRIMQDPGACDYMGCYESRLIERVDESIQYCTFRIKFPSPFRPREYVVRTTVHQNPVTKEVLVMYTAVPGRTPLNDCCFRVTNMNNSWRLTPLENGEVELEYILDMHEGGFLPTMVLNQKRPPILFKVLPMLQKIVDLEQYKNARLDYINEL